MNTRDDGQIGIRGSISDFGATNAMVYTENTNGELDRDVLQNEAK